MPAKSIIEDLMFCIKKKKEKAGVRGEKSVGKFGQNKSLFNFSSAQHKLTP